MVPCFVLAGKQCSRPGSLPTPPARRGPYVVELAHLTGAAFCGPRPRAGWPVPRGCLPVCCGPPAAMRRRPAGGSRGLGQFICRRD
ncbi:unnamed protein product [Amoebophrya sp. A120]|nr:unnamed protein product [Amoebophrya sp. A120]CAD7931856.1 unnamed protein product [Amoebophrya sp. A120]|eukprot:GSA120T00021087001.1